MSVRFLESWRQVAQDRGFKQDAGGWITPGGQRVAGGFVKAVCSEVVEACAPEKRRQSA